MATRHERWLKLTAEDSIDPGLPICDPHHHLWDYLIAFPRNRVPAFCRQTPHYLLPHLLADTGSGHNIVQTVFIECNAMYAAGATPELAPVGETEFVQGIAAQSASGQYGKTIAAAGIIGFADLTLGNRVAPVLEAHIAASRNRFRGIRYRSTWDASAALISTVRTPTVLAEPEFRKGFACLHRYNLSFDAWLYHTQLPGLAALARAFPETPIVLDHIGGPIGIGPYAGKRREVFQDWKQGIAALATCPNVMVKLGGLGMPLGGFGWHEQPVPPGSAKLAAAMAPYFHWCIEQFGVERCMFESNFPVDKASCSYTVLWNAFKRIAKNFSTGERAALFHDTAVRFYRL
jgi:L-fuconolactonase